MRARVLRAVEDDGLRVVDGDAEDGVLRQELASAVYRVGRSWGAYVPSAGGGGDESGEEAAARGGHAGLGKVAGDDAVVAGPEAELDDVADGGGGAAGVEGEAVAADRDGLDVGAGLEGQAGREEDGGEHVSWQLGLEVMSWACSGGGFVGWKLELCC